MKTTFTVGIGIAAVVASVVIVTSYLSVTTPPAPLYISHSPRPSVTVSPISTPSPITSAEPAHTPTPTIASTLIPGSKPSGWRTYRSDAYHYQFNFPPDYYLSLIDGGGLQITDVDLHNAQLKNPGISISILPYPGMSDLKSWVTQVGYVQFSATTVAGVPAIRGKTKDPTFGDFHGDIFMVNNNMGYQISYGPYDNKYVDVFNKIVDTFMFTQ